MQCLEPLEKDGLDESRDPPKRAFPLGKLIPIHTQESNISHRQCYSEDRPLWAVVVPY